MLSCIAVSTTTMTNTRILKIISVLLKKKPTDHISKNWINLCQKLTNKPIVQMELFCLPIYTNLWELEN